jgi:glycosyltransferase involved in cell wall biosynthesis
MPTITALLHTENDALRLGRCLETLYPCDHILVVDHGSRDSTVSIAREYGASVISALPGATPAYYLRSADTRETRISPLFERDALQGSPHNESYLKAALGAEGLNQRFPGFGGLGPGDPGWILCLDPHESVSESLAASLYEWKSCAGGAPTAPAFSVFLREETAEGWVQLPVAQTRLVPPDWNRWNGSFPLNDPSALVLSGELLRFVFP